MADLGESNKRGSRGPTARMPRRIPVVYLLAFCTSALLLAAHNGRARSSRAAAQAILVAVRDGNRAALDSRFWPGREKDSSCLLRLLDEQALEGVVWRVGIGHIRRNQQDIAVVAFGRAVRIRGQRWEGLRLMLVRSGPGGRAAPVERELAGRWLLILAVPITEGAADRDAQLRSAFAGSLPVPAENR